MNDPVTLRAIEHSTVIMGKRPSRTFPTEESVELRQQFNDSIIQRTEKKKKVT